MAQFIRKLYCVQPVEWFPRAARLWRAASTSRQRPNPNTAERQHNIDASTSARERKRTLRDGGMEMNVCETHKEYAHNATQHRAQRMYTSFSLASI